MFMASFLVLYGYFTKFLETNSEKRCVPQPSLGLKHWTWTCPHSSPLFSSWTFDMKASQLCQHRQQEDPRGCQNKMGGRWVSEWPYEAVTLRQTGLRERISMILNPTITVFLGYSSLAWCMILWLWVESETSQHSCGFFLQLYGCLCGCRLGTCRDLDLMRIRV